MYEYSTSTNFPDPDTGEWLCSNIPSDELPSGNNWAGLCDPTLDQLFQDEMVQVDFNTRQQTFYKITKYIFDQVYFLGIWHDPDLWGVNKRLLNVKVSGATPLYNIWEWDLTQ